MKQIVRAAHEGNVEIYVPVIVIVAGRHGLGKTTVRDTGRGCDVFKSAVPLIVKEL